MTEQQIVPERQVPQISALAGMLVTHQRFFETLSVEDRQWAFQNPQMAVALFCEAVQKREKTFAERFVKGADVPLMISVEYVPSNVGGFWRSVQDRESVRGQVGWMGYQGPESLATDRVPAPGTPVTLAVHDVVGELPAPAVKAMIEARFFDGNAVFAFIAQLILRQQNGEQGALATRRGASDDPVNLFYTKTDVIALRWRGGFNKRWQVDRRKSGSGTPGTRVFTPAA